MPLLVKYEQSDSYFSWLSKQLKTPLFLSCVRRPLHALHSTATLSKKHAPIILLSSPNHISAVINLIRSTLSPQTNRRSIFRTNLPKPSQTRNSSVHTWPPIANPVTIPVCWLPARARRSKFGDHLQFPALYQFSGPLSQVLGLKPFHL